MAAIRVETLIKYTDLFGNVVKIPLTANPETAATGMDRRDYTLADSTTIIVWDPVGQTLENTATFGFLAVIADGAVDVEFTTDVGNEVGNEFYTVRVTDSLPLLLGADDSYANVGSDAFGGTLDVIQKIRIRNSSGASRKITVLIGE